MSLNIEMERKLLFILDKSKPVFLVYPLFSCDLPARPVSWWVAVSVSPSFVPFPLSLSLLLSLPLSSSPHYSLSVVLSLASL